MSWHQTNTTCMILYNCAVLLTDTCNRKFNKNDKLHFFQIQEKISLRNYRNGHFQIPLQILCYLTTTQSDPFILTPFNRLCTAAFVMHGLPLSAATLGWIRLADILSVSQGTSEIWSRRALIYYFSGTFKYLECN